MVVNRITTMGGRAGGGARSGGGGAKVDTRVSLASLPDKLSRKETSEYRKLIDRYVVYPLTLNSEFAGSYFHEYRIGESIKDFAKSKELVKYTKDVLAANFKGKYNATYLPQQVDKLFK